MNKQILQDLYLRNHLPQSELEEAIGFLLTFEDYLGKLGKPADLEGLDSEDLEGFISQLVATHTNTLAHFIVLLRYFKVTKRNDLMIMLYRYLGGLDVIENITERLERLHGKAICEEVLLGWQKPPLGTAPTAITGATKELMDRLNRRFTESQVKLILAGNNHGIPDTAFLADKTAYEAAPTLAAFLREKQQEQVKILEEHVRDNKIWFEQTITPAVVEYVRDNQEILSAVLEDEALYLTKIPYDPDGFLHEADPQKKRYLACHCPFAREAIRSGLPEISPLWCYCSAGFTKHPYEQILGQKLDIEILESVLGGSDRCRFKIPLSGVDYKK